MNYLKEEELSNISGGGKTLWYIIGGFGAFLAGIFSGFFNPKACN